MFIQSKGIIMEDAFKPIGEETAKAFKEILNDFKKNINQDNNNLNKL